jgi:hypothetical protein
LVGIVQEGIFVVLTEEGRVVGSSIQRSRASNDVVQRVLGESLHGSTTAAGPVAVRIDGIKRSIVVEH